MTILCVSSKRFQLWRLMRMCRKQSCRRHGQNPETVGFTSAKEALAWLSENTADIALVDINRHDKNGLLLAEKIKELCTGIKIVLISDNKEFALEAYRLHLSGYIIKPVSAEKLATEIDYALS